MKKYTKRFKKNKFNKTFKKGGNNSKTNLNSNKNDNNDNNDKNEGIVDYVSDKVMDSLSAVATTAEDAALKVAGLERINKSDDNEEQNKINEKINEISNTTSGLTNEIKNVANNASATVIENVNEVLGSDIVKENLRNAAEDTANIIKDNAEVINEALNDPEVKQEVKEAIENVSEYANIGIEAMKEPFNKGVNQLTETINEVSPKLVKAGINTINAAAEEIPVIGTVYSLLNIVNNASKAASASVEAGSEMVETVSDAFMETKKNYEEGMKMLEENKKISDEISSRTNKSIKEFESPLEKFRNTGQAAGAHKTRRRLMKRKGKSKRVRFAF